MSNQEISLIVAFMAGFAAFISPCVLPLIPAYISFITGVSVKELSSADTKSKNVSKIILPTLFFILGFSLIFIILGASATFLGSFFLKNQRILQIIGGIIVVIFGLHMAGAFKLKFLEHEKRFSMNRRPLTVIGAFIAGVVFALGWTPCVGPILASILLYAGTQETVSEGIKLLSAFSLGLGIPFLLTSIAIGSFLSVFDRIKKYFRIISILSGIILVIMGILIMTGTFTVLTAVLQ
ncbi:MAG: cytochrome c biogenesis protein CcdA [bacterium]